MAEGSCSLAERSRRRTTYQRSHPGSNRRRQIGLAVDMTLGGGGGSRTRVRKSSAKGVYTLRRFVTSRLSPAEAPSVGIEASLELFRRSAPGVPSGYPALSTP